MAAPWGHLPPFRFREATCSICRDYFKDPVTIPECGHNFCRSCLVRCWGNLEVMVFCPQCKSSVLRRNLISNQQLANIVEAAKMSSLHFGEGKVCEKHQEALKLFCKHHGTLICVVCVRSKEHENHWVIPLEEAANENKAGIWSCLQILKKERGTILASLEDLGMQSQDLLKLTESEKQRAGETFIRLRHLLEEVLQEMEEVKKEIARRKDEQLERLYRKLSSLDRIIQEMEEKLQKPAIEFLQDVRSTFQRYENRERHETWCAFPPDLKKKASSFCTMNLIIENATKQCKTTLS